MWWFNPGGHVAVGGVQTGDVQIVVHAALGALHGHGAAIGIQVNDNLVVHLGLGVSAVVQVHQAGSDAGIALVVVVLIHGVGPVVVVGHAVHTDIAVLRHAGDGAFHRLRHGHGLNLAAGHGDDDNVVVLKVLLRVISGVHAAGGAALVGDGHGVLAVAVVLHTGDLGHEGVNDGHHHGLLAGVHIQLGQHAVAGLLPAVGAGAALVEHVHTVHAVQLHTVAVLHDVAVAVHRPHIVVVGGGAGGLVQGALQVSHWNSSLQDSD